MKQPKPKITIDQVMDACKRTMFGLENVGICVSCGEEQDGCEPDARHYTCEACGKPQVFGAEELLLRMAP